MWQLRFDKRLPGGFLHFHDLPVSRRSPSCRIYPKSCVEYLAEIRTNGRFCKEKSFHSSSFRKFLACHSTDRLSPTTWNHYLKLCQSVFARLKGDTGLRNNPFALPIQKTTPESRAAFTLGELYRIGENLNEFVRPIFITGIFSGFSEGDICLLK